MKSTDFHGSKQPIDLNLEQVHKIVTAYKVEHNDKSFKYFIGYSDGNITSPSCMKLPQMSGFIKIKINTFNKMIIIYFHREKIPKEKLHYVFLMIVTVDSIMRMDKKPVSKIF